MQIRRKPQINVGISTAEAALRESEARYRSLFEHMLDGFAYCQMLFDEHGRPDDFIYLAVNDAFGKLTGLNDVIGKRVTQVLPRIKELNPELFEIYGRVASTGTPERFDIDFKSLGLYLSVSVYSPTKGFFVAVFDNISARKQAEERLQASEKKYRTLFENSMDAVLLTGLEGNVFSANKAACEMFGRSEKELCRVGLEAVMDVSDPRLAAAMEERSRTGAFRGEWTFIREDGSRFPGEITNVVFADPDGQLRTSMIIRDVTDRKAAEEALRKSEERFRRYFKLGLIGMAITSPTKGFIEVNDEICRILGYGRDELMRKTWAELTHPDDLTADVDQFNRVVAGEIEGYKIEKRFVRKDGQNVDTILSARAIHHADGSMGDFVVLLQDVGERKRSEERERLEYRETAFANRVLRAFVELEGDALFDRALTVVLEEMDSRYGIFGYIPQPGHLICPSLTKMLDACEIEGKCIHYPPEKWKGMWAQALAEKRSLYSNEAAPVPPGHPIIHNNLAAPILFQGEVIGLLNIANKNGGYTGHDCSMLDRIAARIAPVLYAWIQRKLREDERGSAEEALRRAKDELELRVQERTAQLAEINMELQVEIDERMRAERAVEAERKRLYDVLETLPVYVILLSSDHHVPFANRFFRERFGESHGMRCFEYLFRRNEPCEICETFTVFKTKAPHHWEWTGPDGRDYDIFDFPFTDTDGSSLIMEMGIDITEQKEAEKQLRSYMGRLEQSNRDLEDFAHVASHDLQEPLRKIQTFSDLLLTRYRESLKEGSRDYLERMGRSAERMKALVLDLLEYSRIASNPEPFTRFPLSTVVREALVDLSVLREETGGEIEVGTLPKVEADRVQMRQLFQNLITNSLKFCTDRKPIVKVYDNTCGSDPFWEIHVSDNGIGFDECYCEKIFKPFQRLHGKKANYSGTGMGLAICRRIVERHGGSITAMSKIGQGATFIVRLPKEQ